MRYLWKRRVEKKQLKEKTSKKIHQNNIVTKQTRTVIEHHELKQQETSAVRKENFEKVIKELKEDINQRTQRIDG